MMACRQPIRGRGAVLGDSIGRWYRNTEPPIGVDAPRSREEDIACSNARFGKVRLLKEVRAPASGAADRLLVSPAGDISVVTT